METEQLNFSFIRFNLDYAQNTIEEQAKEILKTVRQQTSYPNNKSMVGITYSANDLQIAQIHKAYASDGNGISGIRGANQAKVIATVERLLLKCGSYADLKGKFRILPITTTYYGAYNGSLEDIAAQKNKLLVEDFKYIDSFIQQGGVVLGRQNQNTVDKGEYAIGGGISQLPLNVNRLIQVALQGYSAASGANPQALYVANALKSKKT